MATFHLDRELGFTIFQFKFVNHTKHHEIQYELSSATGNEQKQHGSVKPGDTVKSESFEHLGTLEQGNVPVIRLPNVPRPGFRFWSGSGGLGKQQYINANGVNGYTVTQDSSEISEITGHGFRITVDGGGVNNPTTLNIYIQVYDRD